jgi:hypothetical protein
MLTGGGLFLLGAIFGRYLPGRRKGPKLPKPVCGCEHNLSFHDPRTGACHGKIYRGGGLYASCTCKQYSGPQPLPVIFAPEISP